MKTLACRPVVFSETPRMKKEPMEEGLAKASRLRGFFSKMSDGELVAYARKFIGGKGIKSRWALGEANRRLYEALRRCHLLDGLGFQADERKWCRYGDDELAQFSQSFIDRNGIKSRVGLENADPGQYDALLTHHIIGRLEFEADERKWSRYSDDELVQYAQAFINRTGIKNKKGLENAAKGMYGTLWKRHLIGRLEFPGGLCSWISVSDNELVQSARKFMEETGIGSRKGLENADGRLYRALWKRHLLDAVFAPIEQAQELARKAELDRQLKEGIDLYLGRGGNE